MRSQARSSRQFPNSETRKDTRRYLELVVNRYDLNPQPTVSLILEGASENLGCRGLSLNSISVLIQENTELKSSCWGELTSQLVRRRIGSGQSFA